MDRKKKEREKKKERSNTLVGVFFFSFCEQLKKKKKEESADRKCEWNARTKTNQAHMNRGRKKNIEILVTASKKRKE